jgi:large subunit ribosomal protein L6e
MHYHLRPQPTRMRLPGISVFVCVDPCCCYVKYMLCVSLSHLITTLLLVLQTKMTRLIGKNIYNKGRSGSFRQNYRFVHVKKGAAGKKVESKKQTKAVPTPASKWYQADDVRTPLTRRFTQKQTRLRSSITPGTVLIILAGRFRGKRVVFLKQLESGTLLVTGPYKINGVPLRRVNQAYVIATTTKVDVSKVDSSNINDAFFAKSIQNRAENADSFFTVGKSSVTVSDARKAAQKSVDASILAAVAKVEYLSGYLGARFSLTKNDKPHLMKF